MTVPKVGDLIEVECWKHGWDCSCGPGPWKLTKIGEDGWIRGEHATRTYTLDGESRPVGLAARLDAIRVHRP